MANKVSLFVGLDYHQDSIRVCAMDDQGEVRRNLRCRNDVEEVVRRIEDRGGQVHAAIESCNGAAEFAEALMKRTGWIVDLAHPGYVSRMKQSPDKTDCGDAHLLADLVRVGYLPRVWLAPENVRELRRVIRYRQQLVDERRNIKLRIGALLRDLRVARPKCRRWTKAWLEWLKATSGLSPQGRWIVDEHLERLDQLRQQINRVEERLDAMTEEDSLVIELLKRPGIGPVTAWTLRAEIGRFDRFRSGKQLARFCGLSPRNASSGERQADAGLVKAANPQLRTVLIQAAHRLRRCEPTWRDFATRLELEGKPYCVVVAAVANRWIRRLYHSMQHAA